jgi:NAD(P)-dependent dehydrogenase (short-subunit alcohol dehydrogenase family)
MKDRSVLIVGGSSGIGLEIARQAAAAGARITLVGRDAERLAAAAETLGGGVRTRVADAHDDEAIAALFAGADVHDHVVSMIGDSMSGGFLDVAPQTMRNVLASKFWANWMIGRCAAPRIAPGGSLTFTAGTGGRPQDVSASYVANQGLAALAAGLASELAPTARVNAVAPTFMGRQTGFWKGVPEAELAKLEAEFIAGVPLGRLATVREVASTYLHLMSNGFITGQVVAVDGGVMLRR